MNTEALIPTLLAVLLALSFHEYAHAKMADLAGDPTPAYYGRVTMNPMAHLDPMGTMMIVLTAMMGFGLGWGKPVPVNPTKMRNPRWDHFASVAAGPLSNLVQAVLYAVILRYSGLIHSGVGSIYAGQSGMFAQFLLIAIQVNVAIFLFNLIPLGPLDGHWMVGTFMSDESRAKWYLWNRQIGTYVLLGLVLGGQLIPQIDLIGRFLGPLLLGILRFLLGI